LFQDIIGGIVGVVVLIASKMQIADYQFGAHRQHRGHGAVHFTLCVSAALRHLGAGGLNKPEVKSQSLMNHDVPGLTDR